MSIWQHTHTVTTTEVSPDLGEFTEILMMKMSNLSQYAITEAVEPFKLHPTSISYTTEVSPDLGEFTEILDDVSVEMIPLRYC